MAAQLMNPDRPVDEVASDRVNAVHFRPLEVLAK